MRRAFSLVADVLHNDPQVIVFIVGSEVHHYVSVVAFDARGSESECACICMCVRVTSRQNEANVNIKGSRDNLIYKRPREKERE